MGIQNPPENRAPGVLSSTDTVGPQASGRRRPQAAGLRPQGWTRQQARGSSLSPRRTCCRRAVPCSPPILHLPAVGPSLAVPAKWNEVTNTQGMTMSRLRTSGAVLVGAPLARVRRADDLLRRSPLAKVELGQQRVPSRGINHRDLPVAAPVRIAVDTSAGDESGLAYLVHGSSMTALYPDAHEPAGDASSSMSPTRPWRQA